jgi:FkbM family methyltransferase
VRSTTTIPVGSVEVELLTDGDAIARMKNNYKPWEPQTREAWRALIKPRYMVIDVGAYTGVYAIASALMACKVIAIEPHPANFKRLRSNAALNSVKIEMIEAAASDTGCMQNLFMKKKLDALCDTAAMQPDENAGLLNGVTVRSIRLDDLTLCSQVCLIKIDVEHHEPYVLRGGLRLIGEHRPIIVVEVLHAEAHINSQEILHGMGYKAQASLDGRNWVYAYDNADL